MLNTRVSLARSQTVIGISLFALAIIAAWQVGNKVVANDMTSMYYIALGFAACAAAVATLRNWRAGFYPFLVWLMFEDLVRKYMGNGPVLFFGKDVLVGLVYVSLFIGVRKGQEKLFRPPFLRTLLVFFFLGILQVFNSNSPSIWYGLLGLKVYFYYIPLMFVGYALISSDEDLHKFLVFNTALAGVIGALGVAQSILGNTFLNPTKLAPELEELGNLHKVTPISGQVVSLPDSVFVSSGRYSVYVVLALCIVLGTVGYLLLYTTRSRKLVYTVTGILAVAPLLSGSRGCFVYSLATAVAAGAGFLWGAPWRWREAHRIVKAIRRSALVAAAGLICVIYFFPTDVGTRLSYYSETLLPSSTAEETTTRMWDYPIGNLEGALADPNWLMGNGIGTVSLGRQYVARMLGEPPPDLFCEEGYGALILEMGIIAPFLWIAWTAALLYYSWRIVSRLRATRFHPIAFAFVWYFFLLLYPWTYGGLAPYQNYTCNAYLWLLVGILFRLPEILVREKNLVAAPSIPQVRRGGFQF